MKVLSGLYSEESESSATEEVVPDYDQMIFTMEVIVVWMKKMPVVISKKKNVNNDYHVNTMG